MIAIETKGASRVYKSYTKQQGFRGSVRGFFRRSYVEKTALHPTDLQIHSGQIVGLVGANGAGKTTLLKLLSGLISPTHGKVLALGFNPFDRKKEYLQQMSLLLGQKNQLWWDISSRDSFALLAEIYSLDRSLTEKKIAEITQALDCESVLDTQLRRLSLGERMKMEIVGSLLHSPKLLLLDEPTIGLDIVAQTQIRNFLLNYVKDMKPTIILTSHYMDDIAQLADQLLLMSKGRIVYNGSVSKFTNATKKQKLVGFSFPEPLKGPQKILNVNLAQGQQIFEVEISELELPQFLSRLTLLPGIANLTISAANFEDEIRDFMQNESAKV